MVKPVFCRGGNLADMVVMRPLANEHSAVLGAVEDASRRFGGAASGILDRACAPRSSRSRAGRKDGCGCGRTKGWLLVHAAARLPAYWGSNRAWRVSMAQATASSRSATLRRARPWLWPRCRKLAYRQRLSSSCWMATRAQ
jgi:hypothetical protein